MARSKQLGKDKVLHRKTVEPAPGKSCTPFTITVTRRGNHRSPEIDATAKSMTGEHLGNVIGWVNPLFKSVDIFHAQVGSPGCGVGTRLYEAVAAEACIRKLSMRSDTDLTPFSRGFWRKQLSKGRAHWDDDAGRYVLKQCTLALGLGRLGRLGRRER